jgi:hypothetical protein
VNVVSRLQLRRLDRRLDRVWRQGQIDRVLSALRTRTGSAFLGSVRIASTDPVCVAEIAWPDGFSARLGLCHPGAVADLARLLAEGRLVTLSRVVYSGQVWSLDFALGDRPFPLLAGVIALAPGGGEGGPLVAPLVPQTA